MQIQSEVREELKVINIADHIDQEVTLRGIVYKVRALSGFGFVLLQNCDSLIQLVFSEDIAKSGIKENGALEIKGKVVAATIKDKFVHPNTCEVQVSSFEILSSPKEVMPFDLTKKKLDINNDIKFDFRYLSMRHPKEKAIFRIQSAIV